MEPGRGRTDLVAGIAGHRTVLQAAAASSAATAALSAGSAFLWMLFRYLARRLREGTVRQAQSAWLASIALLPPQERPEYVRRSLDVAAARADARALRHLRSVTAGGVPGAGSSAIPTPEGRIGAAHRSRSPRPAQVPEA